MITAVVTADNHLGTYYDRLRPDRLHQRRERLQAGFRRTVDLALDRKAQLFLIAGDLFDRPDPRNAERAFVAAQLARLREAGVAVVAICGNHDSPRLAAYDSGIVPLQEMAALEGLHLLREERCWSEVRLTVKDEAGEPIAVRVRGASYAFSALEKQCPLREWKEALAAPDERAAPVEIILLHYAVEGWETPFAAEPVLSLENLDALTADIIAVGHLHVRNEKRLPGGALLLNPGATERMDFGEEFHESGCFVVRLSPGKSAEAEYIPHEHQPMKSLKITDREILEATAKNGTEGESDPAFVMTYLRGRIEDALAYEVNDKPRAAETMLRIQLRGVLPEAIYNALDANELRQFALNRCFSCDVDFDDVGIRYANLEIEAGPGGFEIDAELRGVVERMLAQVALPAEADDATRADSAYRQRVLAAARDTLLNAYQQIRVG